MKFTMKLLALFFGVLLLGNVANAESPREQLQQMVEQLQKSPNDNALREKIIKLAISVKPAPAVPEDAIKYEGRAQAAFKNAKSQTEYLDAADEYEKAIAVAPWITGYYADMCTIYEKAGVFIEAKKNCELSLIGVSGASETMEIKRRIAGLDYMADKYSSSLLQSNLLAPFDTTLPEFPSGTKYFCLAIYGKEYVGPFERYTLKNTRGRYEKWIVINGSTATGVVLGYLDATDFAEVIRNGRLRFAAKRYVNTPKKLTNPMMDTMNYPRDESLHNTFIDWSYDKKEALVKVKVAEDGSKVDLWEMGLVETRHEECNRR